MFNPVWWWKVYNFINDFIRVNGKHKIVVAVKEEKHVSKYVICQGLLNRWTSQYEWGITAGGLTFNLNNGTKTPLIIVKNLENTFLGMKKVRAWPILTLAMPYVKTEQIQNLALF